MALIFSRVQPTAVISASAGGIFQVASFLSGGGADSINFSQAACNLTTSVEGTQLRIRMSGFVTLPAGTYTATVQPLLYAVSGTFTAAATAAQAICSAAAFSVTVSSASATSIPFLVRANAEGDSTSTKLQGDYIAQVNNAAPSASAALANTSAIVYNSKNAPNIQLAAGVTLTGGSGASTATLTELAIE